MGTAGAAAFAFALGAVIGSFISVVAHRVPRREPFVTGRSRCPSCGETIAARDNVPIVSWLVLRGHCRACGEPISPRYPLIEVATGTAFALAVVLHLDAEAALATGPGAAGLAAALVFVAALAAIVLTDLELRVIPNRILVAAAAIGAPLVVIADPGTAVERLIAMLAAGGGLLLVAVAYPHGMGMGDVKLAALMGLYLGRAVAPGLLVGFLVGALVGVALIARHGAGARKRAIPFGPFLALGGVVALFAGDAMVDWYVDSFFGS